MKAVSRVELVVDGCSGLLRRRRRVLDTSSTYVRGEENLAVCITSVHWRRVQPSGTGEHAPSTYNNSVSSVNFRAAQSDSDFVLLPLQTYLHFA